MGMSAAGKKIKFSDMAAWSDLLTRVVVIFIGKEGQIAWPHYNFDVASEAESIKKKLTE
jgi:hypothetical protein